MATGNFLPLISGKILTQISLFWFSFLKQRNHVLTSEWQEMPPVVQKYKDQLEGRAILVKKLKILPVEAIVRGYITGLVSIILTIGTKSFLNKRKRNGGI
jgi:phosphoribosylaminoimidazole-succinocarboxamide synthase